MRCTRCGNENPETNRFCGMCGATLLSAPKPGAVQPTRVATESSIAPTVELSSVQTPALDPPRAAAPVSDEVPLISGPSFLGLSGPPPTRKRASLSIDPHSAPTSNLDYLLDDEERHRHGGRGKFLLILIALALAVGFGYLRFRNTGLADLNPPAKKPSALAQKSGANESTSAAPAASTPAPTVQPSAPNSTTGTAQPAPDSASPAANSPAPTGAATPSAAPASNAATGDSPKPADATPPAPSPADETAAPTNDTTAAATPPPANTPARAPVADKPKPAVREPLPKPHAATKAVAPLDPVTEAQKYLYGRGVTQDCDRGMRLLKPAANQDNPKAMIEMGALYSAGLCTPRDLPTAYRWFALALRKDPDNMAVQTDLQKLWSEMTQPERQLAIKLSQ